MEFTFTTGDRTAEVLKYLLSSAKLTFSIEHIMLLAVSANEIKFSITWRGLAIIIFGVIIAYIAFNTTMFQYIYACMLSSFSGISLDTFLATLKTITSGLADILPNVAVIAAFLMTWSKKT